MSRIRTIKPDFFINEELAELSAMTRLLFIGLWTQADSEGRLLDRPKRLKAELFPYDNFDVDKGLQQLHDAGFIVRYKVDANRSVEDINPRADHTELAIIQVVNFLKHQHPHIKEAASTLPKITSTIQAPCEHSASMVLAGQEGKGREGKGRGDARASAHEDPQDNFFPEFIEIHEALTGRIFIDETCCAKNWNDNDFYAFTVNWLETKRLSGDYLYKISRLKNFLISDFEKKLNIDNRKVETNGRIIKSNRGVKAEVDNSAEFGTLRS